MNEDQIKEFIKREIAENLSISCTLKSGSYSGEEYIDVSLRFDGEKISSDYFDLPQKD